MNRQLSILIILMIPVLLFGQEQEYKSKERERYDNNFEFQERLF